MRRDVPRGVCVLTTADALGGHEGVARAAVAGGAGMVQLRAPELHDEALCALAQRLARLCRDAGVTFIVNDRLDVALSSGADGVHLGQGDTPLEARTRLGRDRLLGLSVRTLEQARAAAALGADYVGVTAYASTTKAGVDPKGPDGIRAFAAATPLPLFAIGGVTIARVPALRAAGAHGVAVVSAVAAAPDQAAATRALVRAFDDAQVARPG